jgi:hypothetical protein
MFYIEKRTIRFHFTQHSLFPVGQFVVKWVWFSGMISDKYRNNDENESAKVMIKRSLDGLEADPVFIKLILAIY